MEQKVQGVCYDIHPLVMVRFFRDTSMYIGPVLSEDLHHEEVMASVVHPEETLV